MIGVLKGNFNKILSTILKVVVLPVVIISLIDKTSITSFSDFFVNLSFEKFDICFLRYLVFSKTTLFDIPILLSFAVVVLNLFCTASMLTLLCFLFVTISTFILKSIKFRQIKYVNKNANEDESSLYLLTSRFLC